MWVAVWMVSPFQSALVGVVAFLASLVAWAEVEQPAE